MKNLLEKIKQNEPIYRALRTFVQVAVGSVLSALSVNAYELVAGDKLNKAAIVSILTAAIATGLSAAMNRTAKDGDKPDE